MEEYGDRVLRAIRMVLGATTKEVADYCGFPIHITMGYLRTFSAMGLIGYINATDGNTMRTIWYPTTFSIPYVVVDK